MTTRTNNRISHKEAERLEGSVEPSSKIIEKRICTMAIYSKVIVDELGHIQDYVSDLTGAEVNDILASHPEWKIDTIMVANCYYGDIDGEGF